MVKKSNMINIYYSTIMKQTKLYNCLFVLAMLLMASASAMAQEFTLKTVTFLKPGEKATVAVGLKNDAVVNGLQARISLPEGLTLRHPCHHRCSRDRHLWQPEQLLREPLSRRRQVW